VEKALKPAQGVESFVGIAANILKEARAMHLGEHLTVDLGKPV